ncbi:translocation protein TolB [compost metagenome]
MKLLLRRGVCYLGICILLIVMGCSSNQPAHPYASKEPIKTPKLFLPDIFSTDTPEMSITFSPDGHTMYFTRVSLDQLERNIYYSNFENDQWTEPQKVSFSVDNQYDFTPFLTSDGKRLYFSSNRITDKEPSTLMVYRIWYVEKDGDDWGIPQLVSDLPSGEFSISANGTAYVARMDGRTEHIFRAKWTDGKYEQAEKLSDSINDSNYYNTSPYIAPDESFLIFARYTLDMNTAMLYISYNRNGKWTEAEKLSEAINEEGYLTVGPRISPDGKYLFFDKAKRNSAINIYQVDLKETGIKYNSN